MIKIQDINTKEIIVGNTTDYGELTDIKKEDKCEGGDPKDTSGEDNEDISKSVNDLKEGDMIYAKIKLNNRKKTSTFKVTSVTNKKIGLHDLKSGNNYKVKKYAITLKELNSDASDNKNQPDKQPNNNSDNNSDNKPDNKNTHKEQQKQPEEQKKEKEKKIEFSFSDLEPEDKLMTTINLGITNIWMVGPAGCGKSTMARNVANNLGLPYLCISCGIGTSSTEFIGYKYPNREATKFADYYSKPSIILLDEFTALDPSVAQVVNAALANGEIETTTGLVKRNPNCIIIATSNTFGSGADRQYVANNQLDASTIDRFVGGIIEITYSEAFESQYDEEVVDYVNEIRACIAINKLRRVASTRMIQAGHALKQYGITDWRERLLVNWTDNELEILDMFLPNKHKLQAA